MCVGVCGCVCVWVRVCMCVCYILITFGLLRKLYVFCFVCFNVMAVVIYVICVCCTARDRNSLIYHGLGVGPPLCVVPLKSACLLTFCMFGSFFRMPAVNFISDLKYLCMKYEINLL